MRIMASVSRGFKLPRRAARRRGVVAATGPQLHPTGENLAETEGFADQHHRLTAVQVDGLGGQQQQVEPLQATAGQVLAGVAGLS